MGNFLDKKENELAMDLNQLRLIIRHNERANLTSKLLDYKTKLHLSNMCIRAEDEERKINHAIMQFITEFIEREL